MHLLHRFARVLVTIFTAVLIVSCSPATEKTVPSTPILMWQQESYNSVYSVTIEPREKRIPIGEYHEWIIDLRDRSNRPITNARIGMTGGMPSHGHGLPSQPQITEHLGNGRYRIEGVRFNMGGAWVLEFRINSAAGQDAVQFDIELTF